MSREVNQAPSNSSDPRTFGLSVWTIAGNVEPTPMAAHRQRASAIREALESLPPERFYVDSRNLNDPEPRRLVELVVVAYPPFDTATSTSTTDVATALENSGTHSALARTIANLAGLLQPEQQAGRVGRIEFHLGDGNRVRCEPNAATTIIPGTGSQSITLAPKGTA
jgi:hypothetical protein